MRTKTHVPFVAWLRADPTRAPEVYAAVARSGYLDDEKFDPTDRLNWILFCLKHGVGREVLLAAWARWAADTPWWGAREKETAATTI